MDVGRAVVGGEVGERPHRVALHVVVGGELEEVESHLVTMGLLFRFAGADGDQLREGAIAVPWHVQESAAQCRQTVGCITNSRDAGHRSMSEPVRRVN